MDPSTRPRWAPSIAIGVLIWLLYTAVTVSIQLSAGIPYADWFKTAAAAWRTGVLSLAAGTALLVLLLLVLRWDHLWRDPVRLPTRPVMKLAMGFWWFAIALRVVGVQWDRVPLDLLLAIAASGVLVGFAEEITFRGFFLRALREGGRSEASAALWTTAAFGLFHLPNVFMGTGAVGLLQLVLAGLSGIVLYGFRRHFGSIVPAMVAHGAWDISTFLAGGYSKPWLEATTLWGLLISQGLAVAVIVSLVRHDRQVVVLPVEGAPDQRR